MVQIKAWIFKAVPEGYPVPGKDLATESREFDTDNVPEGAVLVKQYYASFDPYMRGRMRDASIKSYSPAFDLGEPLTNNVIAKVVKSNRSDLKEGDWVRAFLPIQEYAIIPKGYPEGMLLKIDNKYNLPVEYFLGPLGMPGLTAFSSFYDIGQPKKGETILISAASGAVGQLVGQLAKHEGLTVIGSVGSDEKLDFITKELGFDAGFNYKKESPADALKRLAPNGIDIYYENVGGEHLEAAIDALNNFGRIVACGMISGYNKPVEEHYPIRNLFKFVSKRLTMKGFIVGDKVGQSYAKEHSEKVQEWLHDGSFKAKISVTDGIDKASEGFVGMLKGENFGKAVLKIADPKE
jgi:NADPH-dependent curcumin reductase CurA